MFDAIIEGEILDIQKTEYINKKGEKINEKTVFLYQRGKKELVEVRVSEKTDYSIGEHRSFDCKIRFWFSQGRGGFFVTEKENE